MTHRERHLPPYVYRSTPSCVPAFTADRIPAPRLRLRDALRGTPAIAPTTPPGSSPRPGQPSGPLLLVSGSVPATAPATRLAWTPAPELRPRDRRRPCAAACLVDSPPDRPLLCSCPVPAAAPSDPACLRTPAPELQPRDCRRHRPTDHASVSSSVSAAVPATRPAI